MTISNYLSVQEAAKYLNLSVSTMNKARGTGDSAPYYKIGRRCLYKIEDLDAHFASKRRRSTSDKGGAE